jgi:hypothetical protein
LYVIVRRVPAALTAAETKVGGVKSTVEPFVAVVAEKLTASLPTVSCTARFDVAELAVGAVYATVTVWFFSTTEASVNWTVDPLTTTPVTARSTPPTITVNAVDGAVVAFNASLYVSVRTVPAELMADELSVGGV